MLNIFESLKRKAPELPPALEVLRSQLKELRERSDVERVDKQRQLCAERDAFVAARDQALPELEAAIATAQANKVAAAEALKAAERALGNAQAERRAAGFDFQLRISRLEHEIRLLAPDVIEEFNRELLAESDRTRVKVRQTQRRTAPHWRSGKRQEIISTNVASIEKRVAAIHEAIKQANTLKLEALPVEEIIARLQAIQESLPEIKDTEVITDPIDVSELYRRA